MIRSLISSILSPRKCLVRAYLSNNWTRELAQPISKFDGRLLGTWKSDRRRTFQDYVALPGTTPQQVRKLKALFGKFLIRGGRGKTYTELDGFKSVGEYEVVARDSQSVVVRYYDELFEEYQLRQIHFEGEHYWLWAGTLLEYFRRVKPAGRAS